MRHPPFFMTTRYPLSCNEYCLTLKYRIGCTVFNIILPCSRCRITVYLISYCDATDTLLPVGTFPCKSPVYKLLILRLSVMDFYKEKSLQCGLLIISTLPHAAQALYAEVLSVLKVFKVFKVIEDHNANLLLPPLTPHLIICPLTSSNFP